MTKLEQFERRICEKVASFPSNIPVPWSSFPEVIMTHCLVNRCVDRFFYIFIMCQLHTPPFIHLNIHLKDCVLSTWASLSNFLEVSHHSFVRLCWNLHKCLPAENIQVISSLPLQQTIPPRAFRFTFPYPHVQMYRSGKILKVRCLDQGEYTV